MQEAESHAHPVVWSSLQPILDELLDQLDDEDRHALLLRFLEQRPLLAVGNALGITEDSARKRVHRALEKLRRRLAARGITTTGGALGNLLTSCGADAVPAGLAARLATTVLATASTAAPGLSFYTLMASTKSITVTVAAVVLCFAGASLVNWNSLTRTPENGPASTSGKIETDPHRNSLGQWFGRLRKQGDAPSRSSEDVAIGAALERLQKALHDPKPTRKFPDQAIGEALALMGDRRAAALPLLLEALRKGDDSLRNRAADALGQLGPEARDAVPILMQQLREGRAPSLLVWTLERVGPSLDLVPELIAHLKDEAMSWLTLANSLTSPVWGDPRLVSDAVRPVLEDPALPTRQIAAYTLALLLREEAGEAVRKVTVEGLRSSEEDVQRMALSTLQNLGADPHDSSLRMTRERLGSGIEEAVPALRQIAHQAASKDLQQSALKLLEVIGSGERLEDPGLRSMLQTQAEGAAFAARVQAGGMSVPELVEGITKHPDAVGGIADVLARLGPEANAALPALQGVLESWGAGGGDSVADRVKRAQEMDRVVEAMRRIAPDQPTPAFKESETLAVLEVLDEAWRDSDPSRGAKVMAATTSALKDLPTGSAVRLTADQMRRLLDALKSADSAAYQAILAKVTTYSPGFVVPPKP